MQPQPLPHAATALYSIACWRTTSSLQQTSACACLPVHEACSAPITCNLCSRSDANTSPCKEATRQGHSHDACGCSDQANAAS